VKRSSSWIAVLPSLVIPVCIGLMMYLGLSYLIQEGQISNETVLRYLTGHPVSKVTVAMFFIGIASLALIASNLFEQFSNERKITFKSDSLPEPVTSSGSTEHSSDPTESKSNGEISDQTVEMGKRLLDLPQWMHEHYLWQRMVNALHSIYRTNSTIAVEDELKYLADLDLDRQQQRYSLVRILIWATPMLGFLGTVLGISQALGGISVGADNNFQQMMDGLRGSLYIAFDTTALALTLSMIMMFGQFLIERFESQLLELVDQRAKQEINAQFDMTVSTPETAYGNIAVEMLNASRESIEQQTENWRKTIHAAQAGWLSSLGQANDQLQNQLTDALDESVSNLSLRLGEAIEKADNSMSHRWGQWQVTLSENARMMATYQEQLSKQTELIHQMLEQSKTKETLQQVLEQNQEAAEATSQLRQALDELGTALAEIKKPKPPAPVVFATTPLTTKLEPSGVEIGQGDEPNQSSATAKVSFSNRERQLRVRAIASSDRLSKVVAGQAEIARPEVSTQSRQSSPEVVLPPRSRFREIVTVEAPSNRNSKKAA
jgi:biopolymer transport protein ExbB/TolQ